MKKFYTRSIRLFLFTCITMLCSLHGIAQYTLTQLESGGSYTAVAKDNSNNIYTTRFNPTTQLYDLVRFAGGAGTGTVIYSGLSRNSPVFPWGIAVNSIGDIFVLNSFASANGQIIRLRAPSYTIVDVVQTGKYYSAITVDALDNIYTLEYDGASRYQVMRYRAGLEDQPGAVVSPGVPLPGGGTSYPWGIVVDSYRNIYITDFLENNSGGALIKLTAPSYTPTTLFTGRNVTALAIDGANNIYTTELLTSTTSQIVKYTDPTQSGTVINTSLTSNAPIYAWGLAVTSNGTIFAGDGAASAPAGGRLIKLAPPTTSVSSVTRVSASPSNANTVTFKVTFSSSAVNITSSAFNLTTTGVTGAYIAIVSGSGTTYNVVVNTGSGNGTVRLNVNGTGIIPTVTNVPYNTGEVYSIDKNPPVISLSINNGAAYTNLRDLTLTSSATDEDPPTSLQMRFSPDSTLWSAYQPYSTSSTYTVSAGDGPKKVYMQVEDLAGNVSGTSATITLDQTPPVVSLSSFPPPVTNQQSATFQFSADEPIQTYNGKLDAGTFGVVTNPVTLTGLTEGVHTYSVNGVDRAGNASTNSVYAWEIDLTPPTVLSVSTPAAGTYGIGKALDFTVNMSEIVYTNPSPLPSLDLIIGSSLKKAIYVSGSGTNSWTFRYTVQDGDNDSNGITIGSVINTNSNTLTDAAGNNLVVTLNNVANNTVLVNSKRPVATFTTPVIVNATTVRIGISFDEPVKGINAGSITALGVPGGITVTNVTPNSTTATTSYTFDLLFQPGNKGTVNLNLPTDVSTSAASLNGNMSASTTFSFDNTVPVVTSVGQPIDGYYKAGQTLTFTVNFSKALTVQPGASPLYLPIVIGTTTVQAPYQSGSGSTALTFSYMVQPGDNDADGVSLGSYLSDAGGRLSDGYGNTTNLLLTNDNNLNGVRVNTIIPTVNISTTAASVVNGSFTADITFSEKVIGLTASSFVTTNASVDNLNTTDYIHYTIDVTPAIDGLVKVSLPAGAAQNIGDNDNSASNELQRTADFTPPVVTAVTGPANGYYHENENLTFTVKFSEIVNVNTVGGTPYMAINLASGVVPAYYVSGSGTNTLTFTYTVQADDDAPQGVTLGAGISLGGGGLITDIAGNNATLILNNVADFKNVIVNTTHPSVTISTAAPALVNGAFDVTISFSEAVTGFTSGAIIVTNGSAGTPVSANGITYTTTITPGTDGVITISVPANAAINIARNGNTASTTTLQLTVDKTAPALQSLKVPNNGWYKTGDNLDFELTYNEPVKISSGTPYFLLQIGTTNVQANYSTGSGTNKLIFRYTVQNGDQDLNGIAYTPNLVLTTGTFTDLAGNAAPTALLAVSTSNVLVNTIPPATTKVTLPANGYYNATNTLVFTVEFNQPVTTIGIPSLPVIIGTNTVNAIYVGGSGTNILSFSYTVQNGDMDMDGIDLGTALLLNGGSIKNAAGLDAILTLNGVQNTHQVNVNTNHPTVTVTTTAPARINAPFTVKAEFSEAVTGLGLSGIQVTNGNASTLQTTDNIRYTFTVTPVTDGNVTVSILADAAKNIGINGNQASTPLNVVADMTAPVVTSGQQFNINQYSAAGTNIGQAAATDASGVLQNWTIASDPSGAFSIDPLTGKITVKDETLLNSKVNTTVTISVTVSDGLNTSVAQDVKITVVYVPLAPTDITINNTTVSENVPAGALVGKFTTITKEPGATFTYTLVSGTGADDNAVFNISGDQLLTNATFVYAVKNAYAVRIRTTQNNGLYTEKVFTIRVLQVNQAPTLDIIPDQVMCSITDKQTYQLTGASPVEAGQTLTYFVQSDKAFFSTLTIDAGGLLSYSLKPNVSGTANITVTVKDNGGTLNGGVDTLRRTFALKVKAQPQIIITSDKNGDISKGDIVTLTATGGNSYTWTRADGILDGQQSATLRIRPLQNTTYEVTATNLDGCTGVQQINIKVTTDFKVDATNILTPNGDGKNDKWVIRNLDSYPNNEVTIYDRTGRVVFHRRNYSNDWDGTLNGRPLSEGTYYYLLKIDGTDKVAKGFITIIRD
ncbi:T9SS type B sorting domain-containing protein [Chitinophaga flava]|uniref:Cadherin domain-containing protein n=1 Tax=Chitinophaga flava TaxID=2259036 RepID=A0A365XVZ0_9BACT|nr:gliding motility-associated C-terminal domain-containing protein [Chitinophaga flava]RBL89745.1 hypothetical protein DF182_24955 [Chitinophaga flava]